MSSVEFDDANLEKFIANPDDFVLRFHTDRDKGKEIIEIEERGFLTYLKAHLIKPDEYKLNTVLKGLNKYITEPPPQKPAKDPTANNQFLARLKHKITKYERKHDKLTVPEKVLKKINAEAVRGLFYTMTKSEVVRINGGITNGWNSCYLDALVQALRAGDFMPKLVAQREETVSLQDFKNACLLRQSSKLASSKKDDAAKKAQATPEDTISKWTQQQLNEIFQKLNNNQTITSGEINSFRQNLIATGLQAGHFSQADTSEALGRLQENLKIPPFSFQLNITPRSDRYDKFSRNDKSNMLSIGLTPNQKEKIPLQTLITNAEIEQDANLLKSHLKKPEAKPVAKPEPDLNAPPQQNKEMATETISLNVDKDQELPPLLPIALNRFTYDKVKNAAVKLDNPVDIDDTLKIPTKKIPQEDATYGLKSIIFHLGGKSANSGHYTCCAKKIEEGHEIWYYYDDATTIRYGSKEAFMKDHREKVLRNSYVVFYELVPPQAAQQNPPPAK